MAKKTSSDKPSKSGVVKELLSQGITAPKDISLAAKEKYNLEITPGYASIIKSGAKKKRMLKPKKTVEATDEVMATAAAPAKGGMEVENAALKLALKAGGIENAIKLLRKLQA